MKVLLVGLGSIGRRHLKNLKHVEPSAQVMVWHQRSKPQDDDQDVSPSYPAVYTEKEALNWKPDVALITSPASLHVKNGLALAKQGTHLFIEKPLSNAFDGIDRLLSLADKHHLVLMVGYNFRFYKPLAIMQQVLRDGQIGRPLALRAEAGQYLPDWRPGQDYRQSVSASLALGGGALLELSHELDYARWLLGEVKTVSAKTAQLSDLDLDVEDMAEIILEFQTGAVGNVHLDMVQKPATRTCRIIGTKGTLTWDGASHRVRLFSADTTSWVDLHPAQSIDRNEMYIAELQHFFDCVRNNQAPIVSGEDGHRVLEIAFAAKRSSQKKRVIEL
jgi:predicted dehydrogenase